MPAASTADDLAFAGLRRQASLLAAGELSSAELVATQLERINATQPVLGAFRVVLAEQARAQARAADRRLAAGERLPLLGVPVAVKDDVDVAGETTQFGCGGEHRSAAADSEIVRRLRAAGAIVVGKTATPELGLWCFTEGCSIDPARNPWRLEHTPGGSSGGSAAAVAAGLVPAAVGSDGAGSIRIPAAWTHLVGLKPQRDRVPPAPDVAPFNGLTCHGPLARTVGDAALLLDALADPGARSFTEASETEPWPLRIALSFKTPLGVPDAVDPEIRAAVERIATQLAALGHDLVPADPDYGLIGLAFVPRATGGVRAWIDRLPDPAALEERTRFAGRVGALLSGPPLALAKAAEPLLRRDAGKIFKRFDAVLTPTTARLAPRVGASDGLSWWATSNKVSAACPFAWAWNVLGWPALNVPAGFSADGLPIGAQLLGRESDEATLLALGAQLEAVERWAEARPAAA